MGTKHRSNAFVAVPYAQRLYVAPVEAFLTLSTMTSSNALLSLLSTLQTTRKSPFATGVLQISSNLSGARAFRGVCHVDPDKRKAKMTFQVRAVLQLMVCVPMALRTGVET